MPDATAAAGEETPAATPEAPQVDTAALDALKAQNADLQARLDQMVADAEAQKVAAAEAKKAADDAAKKAAREAGVKSGDVLGVITALEADLAAEREASAAKDAEIAALKSQVEAHEADATSRAEALAAQNTERIAALPERYRPLVPDGLDPYATAQHIDRVTAVVSQDAGPVGGRGGVRAPHVTQPTKEYPQALKDEAARLNMPPERLATTSLGKRILAASTT